MNEKDNKDLYSLISFEEFKSLMGIDDRDDKICRFCITTATQTIESFCRRYFLEKKYYEIINLYGQLCLILNEYPIKEILAVYSMRKEQSFYQNGSMNSGSLIEPEFYRIYPEKEKEDLPYSLCLSPAVFKIGCRAVKVIYYAGYKQSEIPADLSAACMELAVWYFSRYKSKRIGLTGNVRKEGEQFEKSIPDNVRMLLEPYRRKTI